MVVEFGFFSPNPLGQFLSRIKQTTLNESKPLELFVFHYFSTKQEKLSINAFELVGSRGAARSRFSCAPCLLET